MVRLLSISGVLKRRLARATNGANSEGSGGHGSARFEGGNGVKVERVYEGWRDVVDVEVSPEPTDERPFGGAVGSGDVSPDVEAFADANDRRRTGGIDVDKVSTGRVGENVVVVGTIGASSTIPDGDESFGRGEGRNFPGRDAVRKEGLEPKERNWTVAFRCGVTALYKRGFAIAIQFNGFE